MLEKLKIMLDDGAYMPTRAHEWDAGLDLMSPKYITIPARGAVVIDTGVHVFIPQGYVGMITSRSGLNISRGIVAGEGKIDAGYTGSMMVKLYNHTDMAYSVYVRDKIAQLVIVPVETPDLIRVEEMPETERGNAGVGSTGR